MTRIDEKKTQQQQLSQELRQIDQNMQDLQARRVRVWNDLVRVTGWVECYEDISGDINDNKQKKKD